MKSLLTAVLALALVAAGVAPASAATHHHKRAAHATAHKPVRHHGGASRASSRRTSSRKASRHEATSHRAARHAAGGRHASAHHVASRHRISQPAHSSRRDRPAAAPVAPRGPHHWAKGQRVPAQYRTRAHYISYSRHHLKAPPKGYEWVQVDDNYALVSSRTGVISALAPADKY